MNVLLFALGSHGDVHPFVGIGIRLKQRGHEVAVAANEYFKELIEHAGLEFVCVGSSAEYRALATSHDLWHWLKGPQAVFRATAQYLRPIYDAAVAFHQRDRAGVIAASSLAIGARVAQDRFDIPLASVHLSPSIFQSAYDPPHIVPLYLLPRSMPTAVWRVIWRVSNVAADMLIAEPINALRREVGLPPVRGILRDYWHSPRLTIGLFPEWFAPPPRDWPGQLKLTGFPLYDEPDVTPISAELEAFLRAGEPPIAFTPGSAMWQARDFFDASVAACVRLNRRGLLLTRHTDHLPPRLPANVIHVHYAPFSQLLPRCAAFVHHGGIGSTAQALASGVPQLVTPFTHDQPDNAARVRDLGVASILSPRKYKPAQLAAALAELIESRDVAASCQQIAARFAGVDAIGQTCELIESARRRGEAAES